MLTSLNSSISDLALMVFFILSLPYSAKNTNFLVLDLCQLKFGKHWLESINFFTMGACSVQSAGRFVIGFAGDGLGSDSANAVLEPVICFWRRGRREILILLDPGVLVAKRHRFYWFALSVGSDVMERLWC